MLVVVATGLSLIAHALAVSPMPQFVLFPQAATAAVMLGLAIAVLCTGRSWRYVQRSLAGATLATMVAAIIGNLGGFSWFGNAGFGAAFPAASASALALTAIAALLLGIPGNVFTPFLFQLAAVGALLLSAVDLSGYWFQWDRVFGWYEWVRMPFGVALGVALLAGSAVLHGQRSALRTAGRDDIKITLISTVILTLVAGVAGLGGFSILAYQTERILGNSLLLSLQSRTRVFQSAVAEVAENMAFNLSQSRLRDLLYAALQRPLTRSERAEIQHILDAMVRDTSVRAVSLFDSEGRLVGTRGVLFERSAFEQTLATAPPTTLLWNGGAILQTASPITVNGRTVGHLVMQSPAPTIDSLLTDLSNIGRTGVVAVCAPAGSEMQCLPFGTRPVTRMSRYLNNRPLPMKFALGGESGVQVLTDYRGVKVVAAYGPVGAYPLGMVIKMDRREMYATIVAQAQWLILTVVALLLIGAALLYWRLTPLVRRLIEDVEARKRAQAAAAEREVRLARQNAAVVELAIDRKTSRGDLLPALKALSETGAEILEVSRVGIWLLRESENKLVCADQFDRDAARHSTGASINVADYPNYFSALSTSRTMAVREACVDVRTSELAAGYFKPLNIASTLEAPVRVAGRLAGVVSHEHIGAPREWNLEEQSFAASIADLVALELEAQERKRAELMLAGEKRCLEIMAHGGSLEAITEALTQNLEAQSDGAIATMWLYDETLGVLRASAAPSLAGEYKDRLNVLIAQGVGEAPCNFVVQNKTALYIDNLAQETRWPEYRALVEKFGVKALWAAPILARDNRALGAFVLYFAGDAYPGQNRQALERTLQLAEIAIERKQADTRIQHLAHYDALTALPNRSLFNDRLRIALADAARRGRSVAVMFLDLDRFKNINDSLGHETGDQLLKAVAERLSACVRRGDTIARLGGDEFTIVLADMAHGDDAVLVAQKVIEQFVQPFKIGEQELFVSSSVGITLYPNDAATAEELIKNADVAMYRAKDQGRNNYQFFTRELNKKVHQRLSLERSMRRAIERNEFILHYQPQVSLHDGGIVGVEALLRWRHPELGLVSPAEFIPVAEETGLIVPIGEWVLRTAVQQAKAWQEQGIPPIQVSVNLSARQFQQKHLIHVVLGILRNAGLAAPYLTLELTESVLMQNVDHTLSALQALHEAGIGLSVDDFGTGYASLSYLKRFPIDVLKIDRSFVSDISTDADDAAIVHAIITMAQSLGIKTVAEGVETGEQLAFLRTHGCEAFQGYYFSPAVPADPCTALLKSGRKVSLAERGLAAVRKT